LDEWTNEEFYNPFGPNFLRLKINEDIRLKLLDSTTSCLNNHKTLRFENGDDRFLDAIKNSIADGKIGKFSEEWLKKHPENIIKNTIQNILCRYGEFYYNKPCVASVKSVWYGIMKSGDFHILHSHHSINNNIAVLSGAIYLEVPDNLPYPQGNINWVMGGSQQPLYNNAYEYSPESGDVFLWPGWLMHMVYPFRSKQERIMISFNGNNLIESKKDNG
jgi:hypothetical protein